VGTPPKAGPSRPRGRNAEAQPQRAEGLAEGRANDEKLAELRARLQSRKEEAVGAERGRAASEQAGPAAEDQRKRRGRDRRAEAQEQRAPAETEDRRHKLEGPQGAEERRNATEAKAEEDEPQRRGAKRAAPASPVAGEAWRNAGPNRRREGFEFAKRPNWVRSGHRWGWKVWVGSLPAGTQAHNVADVLRSARVPAPWDINVRSPPNRSGSAYAVITCGTEDNLRDVVKVLEKLRFPTPPNHPQDWHASPLIKYIAA
jgi:hypothetical protein